MALVTVASNDGRLKTHTETGLDDVTLVSTLGPSRRRRRIVGVFVHYSMVVSVDVTTVFKGSADDIVVNTEMLSADADSVWFPVEFWIDALDQLEVTAVAGGVGAVASVTIQEIS